MLYNKFPITRVEELLCLNDKDFVIAAYQILLDRLPEPEGLIY